MSRFESQIAVSCHAPYRHFEEIGVHLHCCVIDDLNKDNPDEKY